MTSSPLEIIAAQLDTDMEAVNATILSRLESSVPTIPEVARHLIAAGGKRIRPLMTLATTAIYGGDMPRAHRLSAAVEFIHSATLLHDDVVDESDERRGKTTANLVYGNQTAVLVGDFLFARSFQLMTEDKSIEILRILSNAAAIIAEGEVMQLALKGQMTMTMDNYIQIISAKTAALFAAATEVAPVIAGAGAEHQHAMHEYGMNLGIAFQIADDALDYNGGAEKLGKAVGDDFREGKLTAPILFALENATGNERAFWQRTLANNQQTEGDLSTAQNILTRHNALHKATQMAYIYGDKAKACMKQAPDHPLKKQMVDLVDYTIKRNT